MTFRNASSPVAGPRLGTIRPPRETFDEERREVLASVREFLRSGELDADRAAACAFLLCHLAGTEARGV